MTEGKNLTAIRLVGDQFEDWFFNWAEEKKLKVSYRGTWNLEGKVRTRKIIRARIYQESRRHSRKFTYNDIDASLDLFQASHREEFFDKLVSKICAYRPSTLVEQFVEAITGARDPKDVAVMKHFVWQVKRKLLGLKVEHHMMPILSGKTGSGKSEAIRNLLSPLQELTAEKDLEEVCDKREFKALTEYYIVYVDEMPKAEKADMNRLKKVITSEDLTVKPLHTNEQETYINRSTFIGTTNESVDMLLKDSRSARRWYQMVSPEVCDWDKINSIDYVNLWNSIDAQAECPVKGILVDIRAKQEEDRYQSYTEIFVRDCHLEKTKAGITSSARIYEKYREWSEKNGLLASNQIHFSKELVGLGFERSRVGPKHKRIRGFWACMPDVTMDLEAHEEGEE